MPSEGRLRLVFHPEDSEPTLHIYAGTESLRRLQKLFMALAADAALEIDLSAQADVEVERLTPLFSLITRRRTTSLRQFGWSKMQMARSDPVAARPSGCQCCAELMPALLEDPS